MWLAARSRARTLAALTWLSTATATRVEMSNRRARRVKQLCPNFVPGEGRARERSCRAGVPGADNWRVPLYDFRCRACGERFEARAAHDDLPSCAACGAGDTERVPTAFAGPFTVALRGAAAKRSNAIRTAREEQRSERKAAREERRARGE